MFKRACVIGFLVTSAGARAQQDFAVQAGLGHYQKNMPSECQIKSEPMKLVFACNIQQNETGGPQFFGKASAEDMQKAKRAKNPDQDIKITGEGANYCYNSLVMVKNENKTVNVTVLRDEGVNPKFYSYSIDEKDIPRSMATPLLPLPLKGTCFGENTKEDNEYCKGMSRSSVPMALELEDSTKATPKASLSTDFNEIRRAEAKIKFKNSAEGIEANKAMETAFMFARDQLKSFIKSNPNTFNVNKMWRDRVLGCADYLDQLESKPGKNGKAQSRMDPEILAYIAKIRPSAKSTGSSGSESGTNH